MTSRALIYDHPMFFIFFHYNRVEVPEIISAEQRCFIDLTLFSADSENMKNISANQLCFGADQLRFPLNRRCSELQKLCTNSKKLSLNHRCSALIYSELALIKTHVDGKIKLRKHCWRLPPVTARHTQLILAVSAWARQSIALISRIKH